MKNRSNGGVRDIKNLASRALKNMAGGGYIRENINNI